MPRSKARVAEPIASRPVMGEYGLLDAPGGKGLVPWRLAVRCLSKSHNYLLATTRPDGRPHGMPVWGVWIDNLFYFSTARTSVKARNLAYNPNCVIYPESDNQTTIVVEGVAAEITNKAVLRKIFEVYNAKYDWDSSPDMGPVYAVYPTVAFGFIEFALQGSATRWRFPGRR